MLYSTLTGFVASNRSGTTAFWQSSEVPEPFFLACDDPSNRPGASLSGVTPSLGFSRKRRTPMQPFEKILFAADFSENSKEAFRAACSLAVENKTRLVVLHVAEPKFVPEEPVYYGQQSCPVLSHRTRQSSS